MSYSASTVEKLPKLAVSMASTPTSKKRGVHAGDDVGPGQAEHLVAALEREPAEVVGGEVETLDVGAEGAVEHDDSFGDRIEVGLSRHEASEAIGGPDRVRGTLRLRSSRMARRKVYTRAGDDGTTGLFHGGRVAKDSELPTAYGHVDEAQAVLGLARVHAGGDVERLLIPIMQDLWVLMAELATDPTRRTLLETGRTAVSQEMIDHLEAQIDELDERFDPPTEFVVPGGNVTAAWLDLARTVVRRAERHALAAAPPPSLVVTYLNRLSDLLWTMARWQDAADGSTLRVRDVGGGRHT